MTVLEAPQEAPPWAMPQPYVGQRVLFYPFGERGPRVFVGYAKTIKSQSLEIELLDGGYKTAVRYVDDPRLVSSPEQKKLSGAWDFTEQDRERWEFEKNTNTRLAAIEKQIASLTAAAARKKDG